MFCFISCFGFVLRADTHRCLCLSKQIRSREPDAALSRTLQVGKVSKEPTVRDLAVARKVGVLFFLQVFGESSYHKGGTVK
jgi:hypothetical protein